MSGGAGCSGQGSIPLYKRRWVAQAFESRCGGVQVGECSVRNCLSCSRSSRGATDPTDSGSGCVPLRHPSRDITSQSHSCITASRRHMLACGRRRHAGRWTQERGTSRSLRVLVVFSTLDLPTKVPEGPILSAILSPVLSSVLLSAILPACPSRRRLKQAGSWRAPNSTQQHANTRGNAHQASRSLDSWIQKKNRNRIDAHLAWLRLYGWTTSKTPKFIYLRMSSVCHAHAMRHLRQKLMSPRLIVASRRV